MRTTLTLDADVAEKLKEEEHRTRQTFKAIVNEALRAGLALRQKPAPRQPRFQVRAHHCGFKPGIDLARLNQIYDQLEAEELADKARAPVRPTTR